MGEKNCRAECAALLQSLIIGCSLVAADTALAGTDGASAIDSPLQAQTRFRSSVDVAVAAESPSQHVLGVTQADWTVRWWRWWMSIPQGVGPTNDTDGTQCGINQEGPVWFIGGPIGDNLSYERSCTVPAGKWILLPVINYLNDYPCVSDPGFQPGERQTLEAFLAEGATSVIDGVTTYDAILDKRAAPVRRIRTGLFGFTAAADLNRFDTCLTGSPQLGVADGYFVFLEPLRPGKHTLSIHSKISGPDRETTGTYNLNISGPIPK
ncbi:MAG: hypothetical protein WBP72_14415 [Rhodocyclaceae bacterium]